MKIPSVQHVWLTVSSVFKKTHKYFIYTVFLVLVDILFISLDPSTGELEGWSSLATDCSNRAPRAGGEAVQ